MSSLERIQAQIAKLQARADELIVKQSSTVIARIREIMDKHGLTTADIDSYVGGKKQTGIGTAAGKSSSGSSISNAKYRDPKTGATWTGHGRAPAWIASAKDRSRFLVSGVKEVAAASTDTVKRQGNYRRGPQPAKYRDPQTGATWSGRGRAPAWLAGVKDLSAYLIDGAGEIGESSVVADAAKAAGKASRKTASKRAVAKKTAAKKTAAKKTAAKKAVAKKAGKTATASAAKKVTRKMASKKVAAKRGAGVRKPVAKKVSAKGSPAASSPVFGGLAQTTSPSAEASAAA
jgi:DNA-binding protein H-NS